MSFLEAIYANLDDDGPRLVYADWLAERGDPRGELIQVQCALAREPTPALEERSKQLLAQHGPAWERELRERAHAEVGRVVRVDWHRGFPDVVWLRGTAPGVPRLFGGDAFPTVRGLRFAAKTPPATVIPDVFARSWRELGLDVFLGDAGAAWIASSLPELRTLELANAGISLEGQRAIAGLPVEDLTLRANGPRVEVLGRALRRIVLHDVEVAPGILADLPNLRELWIDGRRM